MIIPVGGGTSGGVTTHTALTGKNDETNIKHVTDDQKAALDAANSPSGTNALATMNDIPSGTSGVTGPASSVDGNFASFDGISGGSIKDSGKKSTDFAAADHDHDAAYSAMGHDHDSDYAPLGDYAPINGWESFGNATTTSTSGFSVTDNATNQGIFAPGRPLKMVAGATTTYHIVESYTTGAVVLSGATLTDSTEYAISYGDFTRVSKIDVNLSGAFAGSATTTAIKSQTSDPLYWDMGPGVLVAAKHIIQTEDSAATTAQPAINVSLGGVDAFSADDETATTRQTATCNAEVDYGDVVEIEIVKATGGTPGDDAEDLSVSLLFVLK